MFKLHHDKMKSKEPAAGMEMSERSEIQTVYTGTDIENFDQFWKMKAIEIRKKQSELASRHTDIEMKIMESLLLAPFIYYKTATCDAVGIVFHYVQNEKWLEIDEGMKLMKFGETFGYYILSDHMKYALPNPDILKKADSYKIYPDDVRDFVRTFLESESFW